MMPELDGFGVLEHMEEDTALQNIPVLVLTARDLTPQERQQLTERVEGLSDLRATVCGAGRNENVGTWNWMN